jgi:hypothetical protein
MKYYRYLNFFSSVILLSLAVVQISAQTDFKPGYIIENSGDTIFGEIDYRGDLLMTNTCKFKTSDNLISEYQPKDIFGYRFIDGKYFISKEFKGQNLFLEYLIKGKVNIYYYRDNDGDHYLVDRDTLGLSELAYSQKIKYKDDVPYFVESKRYIGILQYYMQDAPKLNTRILNLNEPTRDNLVKLAKDYHNSVCDGEKCIIYEQKKHKVIVNMELLGGITYINKYLTGSDDLGNIYAENKNYFQSGLLFHFSMPRINEKIYLKTGLIYSLLEDANKNKYNYIKIPIHLEYIAPKSYRIRPVISIGLLTPSYSGGIMVRINNRLNMGLQGWINFDKDKILWVPSELINYCVLANLMVEL